MVGPHGENMKVIGIIQARLESQRLPNKALLPLHESLPVLAVQYLRMCRPEIEWWLATTTRESDNLTAFWGESLGLKVFRGDTENVLSRFQEIQKITNADWIIRATGDDPLMNSEMILHLINSTKYVRESTDLISDNPAHRSFPLGFVPEIVRGPSLLKLQHLDAELESYHKAHVTSFFLNKSREDIKNLNMPKRPQWRWTLDTIDDYKMMKKLFNVLGPTWKDLSYIDTVDLLDQHPEIYELNQFVKQKDIKEG